jgi:hypothetical protein
LIDIVDTPASKVSKGCQPVRSRLQAETTMLFDYELQTFTVQNAAGVQL